MWRTLLILSSLYILSLGQKTEKTCKLKHLGKTHDVQEGQITEIRKTTFRVCTNGSLILKKKKEVRPPYKIGCGGCWYGKLLCNGEIVQDLNRWWFLNQCSNGRMRPVGRSYDEVSRDPRFRPRKL